jgi:putative inorganic carbon (hco3(-)) transporter
MPAPSNPILSTPKGQIQVALAASLLVGPLLMLELQNTGIVLLALAIVPLVIYLGFRNPFAVCLLFLIFSFFRVHEAFPKLYPLRIPLALAVLTLCVLGWHVFISRQIKVYWSRELQAFLVFFSIVTAGILFAVSRETAITYWASTYWKIAVMVVAIAWLVRTPGDFELAARALVSGSVLISLVAISNKLAGSGLVEGTRVTIARDMGSVLGDPNDLSLILLFPLGFALCLAVHRTGFFNRAFGAVGSGIIIWAIIATQSRGGLLGVLAVCGIIGLRVVKSKVVVISAGAAIAIALVAVMGISSRSSGGSHEQGIDESAMGRIYAWNAAWKMAKSRPITGVGLDNFYGNYYFYTEHWDGLNHAVHSTWFNVLSETGFPGFIVFVYMIGLIGRSAYRSMRRLETARAPPVIQAMALALVAGVFGFCVAGTFLTQGFTWPIYIILALTTATARYAAVHYPVAVAEPLSRHDGGQLVAVQG